jgi:NarL family two-component system sensor histidine kinase LiaS
MQALDALVRSSSNGKLVCESPVFVSDPERALALYRIAQEALKNTTRHSQAESVEVSLSLREGNYILKICDDGCGFIPNEDDKTIHGLRMMRKRAELLGGTLECKTAKGMGTTIMCRIPKETIDRKY